MQKNNLIALLSQTLIGIFVLIITILFFFGSPSSGRNNPYGLREISYSIVVFILFSAVYFFIGTKLKVHTNRIRNLLSIIFPVILFTVLLISTFIYTRGPNQSLIQQVIDFVVYTFSYNYSYPLVTAFNFNGIIFVIITGLLPCVFMFLGMEIKQKFLS